MTEHRLGITMNGVTGRMGTNQHLIRSVLAIMEQGGVKLANGDTVMPDPVLVGRNAEKVEALAKKHGVERWTTDLDAAIADPGDTLFFDAASTNLRAGLLRKAIDAGKDIYCEKPSAATLEDALELYQRAEKAGIKHGVVQDKIFLPGLQKMKKLMDDGFFGRLLSVKIDFGYWVFEGDWKEAQRPSWNYRKADGGGIILDMMPHWRYVLDNTFGNVKSVSCMGRVNIEKRRSGIRTNPRKPISFRHGPNTAPIWNSTTASNPSGRCSSNTSTRTPRSSGTCAKAPRVCSLPKPRCRAGMSAAGSISAK